MAAGVTPRRPAVSRSMVHVRLQALVLQVGGHVGELRQLRAGARPRARSTSRSSVEVGALERELVLRAAHAVLDREVLHRLHVERDAVLARDALLQALHHHRGTRSRSPWGFSAISRRPRSA